MTLIFPEKTAALDFRKKACVISHASAAMTLNSNSSGAVSRCHLIIIRVASTRNLVISPKSLNFQEAEPAAIFIHL